MKLEVDEQFVREAYKAACNNWRVGILEHIPDLHQGWFKSMVGNVYVFCGEKNTMVEKITTSWLVSPQDSVEYAVRQIKERPLAWEKVDLYSQDWHEMIKSIMRQRGIGNEESLKNLNFYRDKITMIERDRIHFKYPVLLFNKGEWLLEKEKEKDYTVYGEISLIGKRIWRVIEQDPVKWSSEVDRYTSCVTLYEKRHLDRDNTLEELKEEFKTGRAFFNKENAEETAKNLNWAPGKLYWVRDNDHQEWLPMIAAEGYGEFNGTKKGFSVYWNQWKRANCTPDKPK